MGLELFMSIFSWVFIATMVLLITVPYLRGRSDLLTAWNFFLGGSISFVGYSTLVVVHSGRHFIPYSTEDYYRFCLGCVVFYVTLVIVYYTAKFPRQFAKRTLRKWPPASVAVLYFMLPVAFVFIVGMIFSPYVSMPGLYQILFYLGRPVLAIVATIAFIAWYKQIANPILFLTWLAIIVAVSLLTVRFSFGRRPMLAVLMSIPLVMYWLRWRYRRPVVTATIMLVFGFIGLIGVGAYTEIRKEFSFTDRDFASAIKDVKELARSMVSPNMQSSEMFAQITTECSLLAIHMYTHDRPPQPFHTLYYMVTNPIPRVFWENKPESFGTTLPLDGRETYGLSGFYIARGYNWGPGIVGHGYHEGGIIMLVFYGFLFGVVLRYIDEQLKNQSDNPYLIAGFCAASGHILALPRGDIGDFMMHILAAFLAMWLICLFGRMIYGTGLVYPRPANTQQQLLVKRVILPSKPA